MGAINQRSHSLAGTNLWWPFIIWSGICITSCDDDLRYFSMNNLPICVDVPGWPCSRVPHPCQVVPNLGSSQQARVEVLGQRSFGREASKLGSTETTRKGTGSMGNRSWVNGRSLGDAAGGVDERNLTLTVMCKSNMERKQLEKRWIETMNWIHKIRIASQLAWPLRVHWLWIASSFNSMFSKQTTPKKG